MQGGAANLELWRPRIRWFPIYGKRGADLLSCSSQRNRQIQKIYFVATVFDRELHRRMIVIEEVERGCNSVSGPFHKHKISST